MNEIIISSIILITSVYYYFSSFSMDAKISSYPRGLLVLMIMMTCYLIVRKVLESKKNREKLKWVFPEEGKKFVIGVVMFILYIVVLNILGYLAATVLFTFIWMTFIRKGSMLTKLFTTAGLVLSIYMLFGVFLKVPLPEGILF